MSNRYLDILELKPGASKSKIKKAYRLFAKKYHPDVYPGGKEKFLEIAEAYNFLMEVGPRPSNESINYDFDPEAHAYAQARQSAKEKAARMANEKREALLEAVIRSNVFFHFVSGIILILNAFFLADMSLPTKVQAMGCEVFQYSQTFNHSLIVFQNERKMEIVPHVEFLMNRQPRAYEETSVPSS